MKLKKLLKYLYKQIKDLSISSVIEIGFPLLPNPLLTSASIDLSSIQIKSTIMYFFQGAWNGKQIIS